ncbi:MAG: GAF domain-containing protein [Methanimicrococcus sp.]|nr:GAF domain-containing protein [Methanimicrococcus sp.]
MKWSDTRSELEYILNIGPVIIFKLGAAVDMPVKYISNNIIQFGYPAEEFNDYRYSFENIIYRDDLEYVREQFARYSQISDAFGFTITYRLYTKFGPVRWVEQRTYIVRDKDGNVDYYQGLLFDITDQRKSEEETALNIARQEALLKLKKMGGRSFSEIIDYAREEAVSLTKSRIGYIAFPTPDESTLIMHSWSKNSVKECSIDKQNRPYIYPVHRTGLWGEAIRQRKPLIINDYKSPSSLKKGFPVGHVSLYRYMHVPIFDGDRIVIVIGVGNKETDYDESDVLHLTLLMNGLWEVLQKRRMEEMLRERSAELSDHYAKLRSMSMVSHEFLDDFFTRTDKFDDAKDPSQYLRLMEDEVFLMSYEQQQNIIEEGLLIANRMQHLIDSMLYLSMSSGETPPSKFTIVDFKNLYERVFLNTILLLRNKNIVLERHLPPVYPQVIGNEEGLEMVFTTLIENAYLNSPVGGKIILEGNVVGGFFEVRVTDFGSDLDESSLPYLFQSITFVGSGHFHSNNLEGAESGLYVANLIIQEHNGFVSGARNPKGGSILIVKLPVASDKEIKECLIQNANPDQYSVSKTGDSLTAEELFKRPMDAVSRESYHDDGSEDPDDETKSDQTVCQKVLSTIHSKSKEDLK